MVNDSDCTKDEEMKEGKLPHYTKGKSFISYITWISKFHLLDPITLKIGGITH